MKKNIFKSLFFLAALTAVQASFIQAEDCSSCETSCSSSSDLCCESSCCSGCAQSQNTLQLHTLSASTGREILLMKPAFEMDQKHDKWFGTFGVAFEHNRNFGENDACCVENKDCCKSIGSLPFWGANKSNHMTVGSNNGDYDIDAHQLGIGDSEDSELGTITLNPKIYQTGAHMFAYLGAHQQERGFFATMGGVLGSVAVDPRLCDTTPNEEGEYVAGMFGTDSVTAPYKTASEAFAGGKDAGWYKGLKYGKISSCKRSSGAKFGDLNVAMGYNFLADEKKHMGIAARVSMPTGNTANPEYILDPVLGRNDHWGIGGQLMGHYKVWESDSSDRNMTIWFNGTVEHLMRSHHKRSFDLAGNGLGSKYLLLAKYNGSTFQKEIVNAVNVTTVDIVSSFAVEGNAALNFDVNLGNWKLALGYEAWGRTCEKLELEKCCRADTVDLNAYGVLGNQSPVNDSVAMNATDNFGQPNATISSSIDRITAVPASDSDVKDISDKANRINADLATALDICGQRAHSAFTSKVTGQVAHTWRDKDHTPYIGVMGGAEFTHKDNSAVRFWSVGVHGGFTF